MSLTSRLVRVSLRSSASLLGFRHRITTIAQEHCPSSPGDYGLNNGEGRR
jgi:hypothetical protein